MLIQINSPFGVICNLLSLACTNCNIKVNPPIQNIGQEIAGYFSSAQLLFRVRAVPSGYFLLCELCIIARSAFCCIGNSSKFPIQQKKSSLPFYLVRNSFSPPRILVCIHQLQYLFDYIVLQISNYLICF